MSASVSRGAGYVCRFCRSQPRTSSFRSSIPLLLDTRNQYQICFSRQKRAVSSRIPQHTTKRLGQNASTTTTTLTSSSGPLREQRNPVSQNQVTFDTTPTSPTTSIDTSDATSELRRIRDQVYRVAASQEIPERVQVLEILDLSYQFANLLVFGRATSPEGASQEAQEKDQNISLLSDLEEVPQTPSGVRNGALSESDAVHNSSAKNLSISYREKAAAELCDAVYNLLKEPKVVLDEDVLSLYVRIVSQLGHPEYLPEIFFLYANKPMPKPNTKPVQYQDPSPSAAKNAIPQSLADVALDAAILQRDLPLAIAIIDTTVATRAFRRNKFLRKGSIPLAAVGSTPIVAWAGAEWVAQWQDTFDPAMSKYMTMMGAMAYIGTLGTVGFIALTTWNDHHDRVVWTQGTPLRHRWSREEERLYFDRIAVAWGFQKRQRRGEEMGEEWEALREVLGERSMVLDKSDLLEGMQ